MSSPVKSIEIFIPVFVSIKSIPFQTEVNHEMKQGCVLTGEHFKMLYFRWIDHSRLALIRQYEVWVEKGSTVPC